ncbi:MAG: cob(I)yrinic acid a,c-diamide adenosyltransferase [Candidatus Kaelpia imicola]|nr:cob(I)yrinic acid a,c-diamide adenosyltransferase [Candidatus Kaelpia imicola]
MGIVTKRGDKGRTSLLYSKRVDKDNILIEAVGVLDELNAFLGLSKSKIRCKRRKKIIADIQKDLFLIAAELVISKSKYRSLKEKITAERISHLERLIESFEKKYKQDSFINLDSNSYSASINVARVISRKLERRAVSLKKRKILLNDLILIYLNRLSDLLFLLARSFEKYE